MAQILPPETNVFGDIGRGYERGSERGANLASQLLPFLLQRQINQDILQRQFQPQNANPNVPLNEGQNAFVQRTPQEIEKAKINAAMMGGDPNLIENIFGGTNERIQALRNQLPGALQRAGVAETPEIVLQYAKNHPELQSVEDLVSSFQRQGEHLKKLEVPGFWSNLVSPGKREKALKQLVPVAQSYREAGREQEARNHFASQGLSATEMNYLFRPPSQKTEQAIEKLPPGSFKKTNLERFTKFLESPMQSLVAGKVGGSEYEKLKSLHPKVAESQNQKLASFFKENVTSDTSLLVLRDQLWQKGYDWKQIADAFNQAFPSTKSLNDDQRAELVDFNQPPLPSLSDLFGPGFGRRAAAIVQGKK